MKLIDVTSRYNGSVTITNPITRVKRTWSKIGQSFPIPEEELTQMRAQPGVDYIFENYLIINDKDFISNINPEVEPEYFYTKKDITQLLKEGSLDQLEDSLQFGPDGTKELIKDVAIELRIDNREKRKIISRYTGIDLDKIINDTLMSDDEIKKEKEVQQPTTNRRRAEAFAPKTEEKPARKAGLVIPPKK